MGRETAPAGDAHRRFRRRPARARAAPRILAALALTAAVASVVAAAGCASAPTRVEPADLDFAMGAYARAAEGYERMLIERSPDTRRDPLMFRLALARLLAPPPAADPARAETLLRELAADAGAAPEYRAAARVLLADRERRADLERRLARRAEEAATMAQTLAAAAETARRDIERCREGCAEELENAETLRAALAGREAEIARLERELTRLNEALERFKEIDTDPGG